MGPRVRRRSRGPDLSGRHEQAPAPRSLGGGRGQPYDYQPGESAQLRELTPAQQAIADALTELLVLAVLRASPYVKRWWEESFLPTAKTAIKRLIDSFKAKRGAIDTAEPSLVYIATRTDATSAIAHTGITMTKAEWVAQYQAMLDASQFSEEQRRLLSVARIIEAEGDPKAVLTPRDFAERISSRSRPTPACSTSKTPRRSSMSSRARRQSGHSNYAIVRAAAASVDSGVELRTSATRPPRRVRRLLWAERLRRRRRNR